MVQRIVDLRVGLQNLTQETQRYQVFQPVPDSALGKTSASKPTIALDLVDQECQHMALCVIGIRSTGKVELSKEQNISPVLPRRHRPDVNLD